MLIGDSTTLLDYEHQFMGSLHVVDRLWKKLVYIFLLMIDINDKFNLYSTINYYNVR